jgi:hypothetical protein
LHLKKAGMSDRDLRRLFDPLVNRRCLTPMQFGLETLRNLPEVETLDDAGLLSRHGDTADMMPMAQTKEEDPDGQYEEGFRHERHARSDRIASQFTATSSRQLFLKTAEQTEVVERWCFLTTLSGFLLELRAPRPNRGFPQNRAPGWTVVE